MGISPEPAGIEPALAVEAVRPKRSFRLELS